MATATDESQTRQETKMTTVQVKLRFSNELMEWRDRSVFAEFDVIPGHGGYFVTDETLESKVKRIRLTDKVQKIAQQQGAVESRWNFKGVDQGHYEFTQAIQDDEDRHDAGLTNVL